LDKDIEYFEQRLPARLFFAKEHAVFGEIALAFSVKP